MGKLGLIIVGICLLFAGQIMVLMASGAASGELGIKLLPILMAVSLIGFKLMDIIDD